MNIRSGQDTTVQGSSVIGDAGVNIQAGGDVNIVAAQTESQRSHFLEQKNSGVSFEGAGITYGSQRQSTDQNSQSTTAVGSTVGAITGDVNITAGKTYTQTGSDVMAPGGDITIAAQNVQITEARETTRSETEQQFEKSGITLAVSGPAVAAMQTISSQMEAAEDTKDTRMQGLAVANSAMALNNAMKDAKPSGGQGDASSGGRGSGLDLTLSIGSSSSESKSLETTDTARGSTVSAGGNISITASGKGQGAGERSDILIRGSDISAGNNVNPGFKAPYVPDTQIVTVRTTQPETFVRVYVQDPNKSDMAGSWMMRADDIQGLTSEQIASKYALPQVPTHMADVTVPAGNTMRVSVANDVQIRQGLGGNGGGGGVQFEVTSTPKDTGEFRSWFSNPRTIK